MTTPTDDMGFMRGNADKKYRLRSTMSFHGAPVDWNARAVIWSGNDWRYWLRCAVLRLSVKLRTKRSADRRYKASLWLWSLTDDRWRRYTKRQAFWRRVLNTQADVEARMAWSAARSYWQHREADKIKRAS